MTYRSHVFTSTTPRPGELRRTRCVCGLIRRVTIAPSGAYVHEESDDGETWRAPRYGLDCARRVTPDDREA